LCAGDTGGSASFRAESLSVSARRLEFIFSGMVFTLTIKEVAREALAAQK
jgi:hypothetical protein